MTWAMTMYARVYSTVVLVTKQHFSFPSYISFVRIWLLILGLAKTLLDQTVGSPCERRRVAINWVTSRSGCDGMHRTWLDVQSGLRKHWWQQCECSSLWSSGLKIEAWEAGRR